MFKRLCFVQASRAVKLESISRFLRLASLLRAIVLAFSTIGVDVTLSAGEILFRLSSYLKKRECYYATIA
jgi:hypothetical protein